nr:3'-5' exonuclease [Lysobacter gilvus]
METTGLDPLRDEIIEIGAIRVNRDSVNHDTFEIIVRPVKKVPAKITQLTGITQAMVDGGDDLDYSLRAFCKFVGDLPLVAFNADFDMAFLRSASNKCGVTIPQRASCALKMARRAWPERASYKLKDLARDGNLGLEDEHRSLGDCKRALIVYTAAASRLGTTN